MNIKSTIKRFINDESGQGLTEYTAILAFVAMVVALVFGFTNGTLMAAISQSFSTMAGQLNRLCSASNTSPT